MIKDGKVYLSDFSKNKAISGISLFKIHNDTDGVIDYCEELFIEPHGMLSSFLEHPYYTGFNVQGKAGDDWRTKVWIECPNGKSPKAYKFFTKEEIANKKHKQRILEQMRMERRSWTLCAKKNLVVGLKRFLNSEKAPKKIQKDEIIMKEDEDPFEDGKDWD